MHRRNLNSFMVIDDNFKWSIEANPILLQSVSDIQGVKKLDESNK